MLNQTYRNLQIVVVDDGSQDNSVDVIGTHLHDERIEFHLIEKNRGACAASNLAISKARGKYFSTLNSDDYWELNKIARQVETLEANSLLIATFSMARLIDEQGLPLHRPSPFKNFSYSRYEWLAELYANGNCLCHPSVLMRTNVFSKVGQHKDFLASLPDYYLWIKVLSLGEILVTDDRFVNFRIMNREENASGDNPGNRQASMNEWFYIVSWFRNFCNAQDFPRIFTKIKLLNGDNDFEFLFARECTNHHAAPVRAFGVQLLYELMADDARARKIQSAHDFSPVDTIRLAASVDAFRGEELRTLRIKFDQSTKELIDLKSSKAYQLVIKLWRLKSFVRFKSAT